MIRMNTHVAHFHYVGRPEGASQATGYSVVFGRPGFDAFGKPRIDYTETLNEKESTALGYDFGAILGEVAGQLLAENTELKESRVALKEENEALHEYNDALATHVESLKEEIRVRDNKVLGLEKNAEALKDKASALEEYADASAINSEVTQEALNVMIAREDENRFEGRYI